MHLKFAYLRHRRHCRRRAVVVSQTKTIAPMSMPIRDTAPIAYRTISIGSGMISPPTHHLDTDSGPAHPT